MFQDKSILFIAPLFHGYEQMIIRKLEETGARVTFFPERDYSARFKIVNNFFNGHLDRLQSDHYRDILKKIKNQKFDYLFVIRGYKITTDFLRGIRALNPGIRTIMYQWDSNNTNPYAHVIPCFDRVLSFDYEDCNQFSIGYQPLFHTDDLANADAGTGTEIYDFFFMGTYLPERYRALINFRQALAGTDYRLKSYIYIPKSSLIKEKLKGTKLDRDIVSTVHLSRPEYLKLLAQSKAVVDVSNSSQTGLAMRVIEALAMHKKVLTNNRYIAQEPCFNKTNIHIFDASRPSVPKTFLDTEFLVSTKTLSIKEWLDAIFAT